MEIKEILTTCACIAILLIIYYAGTFDRRKQEKELKKMQDQLKKGDKIITFSGLAGIIDEVKDDRVIISLYPDKVKISVEKWAVAGLDDRTIEDK